MKTKQLQECMNKTIQAGKLPTWASLGRLMGKDPKTVKSRFGGKFKVVVVEND